MIERMRPWKPARARDAVGRTLAAFGCMLGGAALGDVDGVSVKQRVTLAAKVAGFGQRDEGGDQIGREVRLRIVEEKPGLLQRQA